MLSHLTTKDYLDFRSSGQEFTYNRRQKKLTTQYSNNKLYSTVLLVSRKMTKHTVAATITALYCFTIH